MVKSLISTTFWSVVLIRSRYLFEARRLKVPRTLIGIYINSNLQNLETAEEATILKIYMLLQSNFIEITLWHGCSPVNLLHIFRAYFPKTTPGWPLLKSAVHKNFTNLQGNPSYRAPLEVWWWKFKGAYFTTFFRP